VVAQPVAFEPGSIARNAGPSGESELAPTLRREMGDNQPAVRIDMQVRRLTPVECERLQGFPDNYTNIPWRKKPESPDGPRYKALGNSMAVPVMRWIGERISKVDQT
jgi:DNA (cytosine-5)-methyltransferase 1